ncbi:hypothetical protein IGI04_008969 [Brassica rapa subsp. trilocularis]|uniref:Uncharacterized protein n=1 Tax=Brassica rapa subsp. trilocularis TaxID=1813537 RepID=A0ABQ7MYG7_BRACM|nr:hypothetical protein IGI04_008969 [Brassica rapa subsp. trilocularis]
MDQIILNSNPFLLTLFALLPVLFFGIVKNKIKLKKLNLPPSPSKLPLIGNLHQIGNLPHNSLHDLSLKHGPLMFVNLGTTRYLIVSSADALEEITKNHDITISNRPTNTSLNPLKGNGQDLVYHPYGDHWKELRKISAIHLMSKNVVNRFQTLRDEEISSMLETIHFSSLKGEEIDMSDMFNTVVSNVVHRSYTGSYKKEEKKGLENATRVFLNWDGIFVAAIESVALELEWLLADLIKHPQVMRKAQEEVQRIVGTKPKITNNEIDKMQYLKCVIKETMRLHPAGTVPRETSSKWIKVGGYDIPPKTKLLVNLFSVQRDPKIWENAEDFIPERFLDKSIEYMGSKGYAPFGFGRRNCPGMAYGNALLEEIMANLLYRFDWKIPDGSKPEELNMEEVCQFVVAKKYPLKLVPVPRFKSNA